MADFTLIIGNKNYSSWSLRAWLMVKRTGAAFDEELVRLYRADSKDALAKLSPSGLVPVLRHGDRVIWESLAIGEYLAELFPAAGLWPEDEGARAHARTISAEMHAGFLALRENMPMDIRADKRGQGMTPDVERDVARIRAVWEDTRARFGARSSPGDENGGEMLFGGFTIADAMYAPVVTRFRTYGVDAGPVAAAYGAAVMALPEMTEWAAASADEPPLGE